MPVALAVAILVVSAALTIVLILAIEPLLVRYVMATPNARSSHAIPTPQGGGIAVMLAVIVVCGLVLLHVPGIADRIALLQVLVAAFGLSVLGLTDDARALSVPGRFIGQALAALIVIFSLPPGLAFFPDFLPLAIERALLCIGVIYFVNAVNFLDGIDMITAAQTVPMTLGAAILTGLGHLPSSAGVLALALLGGMIGFSPFNKHKAKLFLGDAGSLPIGLCLAYLLILVAGANMIAALLLALYTLSDSMVTLCKRAWRREPIFSAHRSHYYQRATSGGYSVPEVSGLVFLLGLLLAGLGIAAVMLNSILANIVLFAVGAACTAGVLYAFGRTRA
jgi:UDP-N-acetylmuramyl pentapeptide phosphotransferase/UDP-N-acetylglucosamine-1-phosphate transferase